MNRRVSPSFFQQLFKTNFLTNGTVQQVEVWHFWDIIWFQSFLKSCLRDFETFSNSCLVWFEQQSQSEDVWFSALEQHASRAKSSKYKAGSGPVLRGCSMDVRRKWKQLWRLYVHSRQTMHQVKQVTSPVFIRHKRETESVETSLAVAVTFCFCSTMHSWTIMNAFTIIITTRMHVAWTSPKFHRWRRTSAYQHRSRREPNTEETYWFMSEYLSKGRAGILISRERRWASSALRTRGQTGAARQSASVCSWRLTRAGEGRVSYQEQPRHLVTSQSRS